MDQSPAPDDRRPAAAGEKQAADGPDRDQPSLSLPKAGGAIRGMGEKFATNPLTGTASMTVPVPLTAGRDGAAPTLALAYDTGAGNGPFGLGWSMDVPSIGRRTDKGLPRYLDDDVFQLSGAEDLVPAGSSADVVTYRPRTEGGFARIERHGAGPATYWQVTSRDNVVSVYGRDPAARITDPADGSRIYRWLLERTVDDRGNVVAYEYKADGANRLLKRIRYGLRRPDSPDDFCFEVVLDYGEHDTAPDEVRPWPLREDPFSTRRPGFEVRTQRLCRRILMFHHFPELGTDAVLVSSTDLDHAEDPAATKLVSVTHRGYIRAGGDYTSEGLPPLTFTYTPREVSTVEGILTTGNGDGPPRVGGNYRWTDLDGEGIAGLLAEEDGGWYYRPNLGAGAIAASAVVAPMPTGANLSGEARLMDLTGDGRQALARLDGVAPGFHRRTEDRGWTPFATFEQLPQLDWASPNLRLVDLTGDGLADVLITGDDGLTWHPSAGLAGYGDSYRTAAASTEERGPLLVFADAEQSIYLADMTGDGLTDLVRVRNGEIAYWPSLGYSRFGPKVTMADAPVFDHPDRFDQRRIRLSDVDGSAPADLLYLGPDGVRVWFNQAGNSWSAAERLAVGFAPDPAGCQVLDLLGRGTASLVVAETLPDGDPEIRYLDLMATGKPHLLCGTDNSMGLTTTIRYESSTTYYLADKAAGRPWATRLAFPVLVVAETTTQDSVADTTLVTSYRYRHGFYDGIEREFRGFGYVEQRDSLSAVDTTDRTYQPPAVVKRWQHNGWYADSIRVTRQFEQEYWPGADLPAAPETVLPAGLSTDEEREAVRALRGKPLREEVYTEDGHGQTGAPYAVTESSYLVSVVQDRGANPYAVVLATAGETISVHTEQSPTDPRITHSVTLDVDAWGNVRRSAEVAYPRRVPVDAAQGRQYITVTEHDVVNDVEAPDRWRVGIPVETRVFEVGGIKRNGQLFTATELRADTVEIPFQQKLSLTAPERRLVARNQRTYAADGAELPLGQTGVPALTWRDYRQAFAPGQIADLYGDRVDDTMLAASGLVQRDSLWWAASGRHEYDPASFFLPTTYVDPFEATWHIGNDPHLLRPIRVADPAGNLAQVALNYRVLQPWLLTDANGNHTGTRYDALGMVVATALMGKGEGDKLDLSTVEHSDADDPTSYLEYDLTLRPVRFRTFSREQHAVKTTRWQETRTYVDGTGRIIQVKSQAEPGDDGKPRWVGTGRTIYDNKGNPIKQYEPYFAPDGEFDTETALTQSGVTTILRYDPLGRLIRTDYPDGTLSRVVFDAWDTETWDRNDTVRESSWYETRSHLPLGDPRRLAADAADAHANTPTVTRSDTLGQVHVTIADNGTSKLTTTVERDVQGNDLLTTDPREIVVLEKHFDMLGRAAHTISPDAGDRWSLVDVYGRPVRGWDGRGNTMRWDYDTLGRPAHTYGTLAGETERLRLKHFYGEAAPDAAAHNLRGHPYATFDGAGLARTTDFDFKGNALAAERRFAADPLTEPDWSAIAGTTDPDAAIAQAALESTAYRTSTVYDALNRPTAITGPDGSVTVPTYNEANLLESLGVRLHGAADATTFVSNVDYNARGQRILVELGCGARTDYEYEHDTFRLATAATATADAKLQALDYTYDPVGNIVLADDPSQDTVFFANTAVGAARTYTYDPTYRLVRAAGREHLTASQPGPTDLDLAAMPHANDSSAMRGYTEQYTYDDGGNLLSVAHAAGTGNWTRRHNTASNSNRLLANSIPGDGDGVYSAVYTYDASGNMTSTPQLARLDWDVDNRLAHVDLGGGGDAYYQYDATGQRVRATVRNNGTTDTRIYLGQNEIYRRSVAGTVRTERQTLRVADGTRTIAVVETTATDTVHRYQLTDHLGSTAVELDENSALLSYEEYHPFGTTSFRAATGAAQVSLKRYRFTGKEKDTETGLYYHGARYYACWLGRWLSPDPAGFVDGPNIYAYSRNNPVVLTDPNGKAAEDKKAPPPPKPPAQLSAQDRATIVGSAKALLQAHDKGIATFDATTAKQLTSLANAGADDPLPDVMTLGIAKIVLRMVDKATERRATGEVKGADFNIVSLARPSDKGLSPHRDGGALDIDKYAGKSVHYTMNDSSLDAVAQFYQDMVGDRDKGEGPVDTTFAMGLPRTPRWGEGDGAVADANRHPTLYDSRQLDEPWLDMVPVGKGKDQHTEMRYTFRVPVLKPEKEGTDTFFPRWMKPNDSPSGSAGVDIKLMMPDAQQRLTDIYKQDKTHILRYFMPDGLDHFHVQSPPTPFR